MVLLFDKIVNMAIDIWPWAINRATSLNVTALTVIDKNNPANEDWIIDTVEVFVLSTLILKIAIFEPQWWTLYKTRSVASLWKVTWFSKQTYSWLSLTVKTGDFLWLYCSTSWSIARDTNWFNNIETREDDMTLNNDIFSTTTTFSWDAISIYWYSTVTPPTATYNASFLYLMV